jgi:hypothetical protein
MDALPGMPSLQMSIRLARQKEVQDPNHDSYPALKVAY